MSEDWTLFRKDENNLTEISEDTPYKFRRGNFEVTGYFTDGDIDKRRVDFAPSGFQYIPYVPGEIDSKGKFRDALQDYDRRKRKEHEADTVEGAHKTVRNVMCNTDCHEGRMFAKRAGPGGFDLSKLASPPFKNGTFPTTRIFFLSLGSIYNPLHDGPDGGHVHRAIARHYAAREMVKHFEKVPKKELCVYFDDPSYTEEDIELIKRIFQSEREVLTENLMISEKGRWLHHYATMPKHAPRNLFAAFNASSNCIRQILADLGVHDRIKPTGLFCMPSNEDSRLDEMTTRVYYWMNTRYTEIAEVTDDPQDSSRKWFGRHCLYVLNNSAKEVSSG